MAPVPPVRSPAMGTPCPLLTCSYHDGLISELLSLGSWVQGRHLLTKSLLLLPIPSSSLFLLSLLLPGLPPLLATSAQGTQGPGSPCSWLWATSLEPPTGTGRWEVPVSSARGGVGQLPYTTAVGVASYSGWATLQVPDSQPVPWSSCHHHPYPPGLWTEGPSQGGPRL